MAERKNINRGYMQLRGWQDAEEYYRMTSFAFRSFPYELKRVASPQISSAESVSGLRVYRAATHIDTATFKPLDAWAYKLENGPIKLIESLQHKQQDGGWDESFILRESNESYGSQNIPVFQNSNIPTKDPP